MQGKNEKNNEKKNWLKLVKALNSNFKLKRKREERKKLNCREKKKKILQSECVIDFSELSFGLLMRGV